MARQSTTPIKFQSQRRTDELEALTSGRAGVVLPVGYIPLFRGDSASGRVSIMADLAEMPRPLRNSVNMKVQAWYVPKSVDPRFAGYDDYMYSYQGEDIKTLGNADRTPPSFFQTLTGADVTTVANGEIYTTMGLHVPSGEDINTEIIDAYNLIYNFRLAAHSDKLTRRDYPSENLANSTSLAPAFWPRSRLSTVVPDYERALVVGSLELDVTAGEIPIKSWGSNTVATNRYAPTSDVIPSTDADNNLVWTDKIWTEFTGQTITASLADITKARETQAFAKLRSSYAGTDGTGFDQDSVIVAELMQGFDVPSDEFQRPWLLDSKSVKFGMTERHATDAANLDDSVTRGNASLTLNINVPKQNTGGIILYTVEVLPDLLTERAYDDFLHVTQVDDLPDALRDSLRVEPVDVVPSKRVDTAHTTPNAGYGFEPMNAKWSRKYTRMGGEYKQDTPGTPNTDQRAAIWQVDIVDPAYADDHYLAPTSFPHDVFSAPTKDAFDLVVNHNVTIVGMTQVGDTLVENNDEYADTAAEAPAN